MTPAARVAAAIEVLSAVIDGAPAEARLIRWARSSRFAGSADRAAVRDLVFDALRRRRSRAALGGGEDARALLLGGCRDEGIDPARLFTGEGHAPAALTDAERAAGRIPTEAELTDLPDWIAARLAADLGPDFGPVAAALRDRAPVWLRVNLARTDRAGAQSALARDGIETQPDVRCATALRVTEGTRRIQTAVALRDGLVEPQDLSPQMACAALTVGPAMTVLDYCAGGGGKALAFAARGARVTAWDASPARMRDLPARSARAGAGIRIASTRPTQLFDLVVADVPCSGSGTWRRTPDARWRLTPTDLERLTALQDRILDEAALCVGVGGTLAYMTCSLLRAENEDRIAAFLARRPDFRADLCRTLTPLTASDGFFVARLALLSDA